MFDSQSICSKCDIDETIKAIVDSGETVVLPPYDPYDKEWTSKVHNTFYKRLPHHGVVGVVCGRSVKECKEHYLWIVQNFDVNVPVLFPDVRFARRIILELLFERKLNARRHYIENINVFEALQPELDTGEWKWLDPQDLK